MSNFRIKTPHAAMLIWNYVDRVGIPGDGYNSSGVSNERLSKVEGEQFDEDGSVTPVIVSTLSCISIQTQKTKGRPDGSFQVVLAPFKNWVGNLTAGSWCVLLMSNEPITEHDLKKANKHKVKMFGRIESVRCETRVDENNARNTLYYVSGTDWGDIFNSTIYIDNYIKGPNDTGNNLSDVMAVAIRKLLFGADGTPQAFSVRTNLRGILNIMGNDIAGLTKSYNEIGRLSNAMYQFTLPREVASYFNFRNHDDKKIDIGGKPSLNKVISLRTGHLIDKDKYSNGSEAEGFVNPFTLQGTHTLWQILLDNSNPALNEMLCDFRWSDTDDSVEFAYYNRIRPFSFRDYKHNKKNTTMRSFFQDVKTHALDRIEVISVNAGSNWRDKINFIEIRPEFQDFYLIQGWIKQKCQVFDPISFNREGFRSLIVSTKQFPARKEVQDTGGGDVTFAAIDWSQLSGWAQLMKEWFFGTHRMLNGTIVIHGSTNYIGVGDNIKFDAGLLNPNSNINKESVKAGNGYILAHVESVQHTFTVNPNGARSYITTIQFVRGITVKQNNELLSDGMLDQDATLVTQSQDRNRLNTVSTSDLPSDPDPKKVRGN